MSKILVIETNQIERERIAAQLMQYLGEKLQVFFAQTVEEAEGLLHNREGWTNIVFGTCRDRVIQLVQFVRALINTHGFERGALIVLTHDTEHRIQLVFAGCDKEVVDEEHLGDVLGTFLFNLTPPFRRRRRRSTL